MRRLTAAGQLTRVYIRLRFTVASMASVIVALGRQFATALMDTPVGLAACVKSRLIAASVLTAVNSAAAPTGSANATARRATVVPAARFPQTLANSQRVSTVASTATAFHRRGFVSALMGFLAGLAKCPQICAHQPAGLPQGWIHLIAALTVAASRSQKSNRPASARTDLQAQFAIFHRTAALTLHQLCVGIMGSARKARASAQTATPVIDVR